MFQCHLLKAIKLDRVDLIVKTLKRGKFSEEEAKTVTDRAFMAKKYEIVKILLQDPRIRPIFDCIERVFDKEHREILLLTINHPLFDPRNYKHRYPLTIASRRGNFEIFKLLLEDSRNNPYDWQVLYNACLEGHVKIVERLFEIPGIQPSVHTIVHACEKNYGRVEIVKMLVEKFNVEVNVNGNTPLKKACFADNFEIAKYLLQFKSVIDTGIEESFAIACSFSAESSLYIANNFPLKWENLTLNIFEYKIAEAVLRKGEPKVEWNSDCDQKLFKLLDFCKRYKSPEERILRLKHDLMCEDLDVEIKKYEIIYRHTGNVGIDIMIQHLELYKVRN